MASEAARARLHQQEAEARAAFRVHNACVTLAGDPVRHRALCVAWRPLWDPTDYIPGVADSDVIDDIVIDE